MLRLENIDVTLGKNTKLQRQVLHQLNLNIRKGEFIVIIGGNGAGKSTIFNVVSGSIKPDSGKIFLYEQDITANPETHRGKFVSKVVQDPKAGTMENMTIFENLAFALKRGQKRGLQLFNNKSSTILFKEKLKIINLEDRLNEIVSNLSGGQRQILSLTMAMLQNSELLLLDEITAALDPITSDYIMELTNKIVKEQQFTCIMITHNMKHAIKYGDKLILLKNGKFIKEYDKATKSVLSQTELMAEFNLI